VLVALSGHLYVILQLYIYSCKALFNMKIIKTPKGQYNQKKVSVNICITPDATVGLDAIAQSLKISRSELIEQIGRGLLKVVKSDRP